LPDVAKLAVDRSHGTLIRASAAEFAWQLMAKTARGAGGAGGAGAAGPSNAAGARGPREHSESSSGAARASGGGVPASSDESFSPAIINSLIGAASDPEPQVRTMAVRALSLVRTPQVLSVLGARLVDDARVVRINAAEALLNLGIISLEGSPGAALSRAQDEWMASLATFNDVADDHTTLARVEAARGRTDEAAKEFTTAARLDPTDPKPHVYLGVLAARASKFTEALQQFKIAKTLAPSYQNLDRLIEEAQKRATNRY